MNLACAKQFFDSHNDFILAAHRSPDGDTLGSCLALSRALQSLGKHAIVACVDAVPKYLRFLSGSDTVVSSVSKIPEAAVYIDCGDHSRADALEPFLEQCAFRFCIDHHGTNPKNTKDGDWVEEVGATGELIYRLLTKMQIPIDREIAVCLFTAIATDTGNFSYSNTTSDTFRIAGELLQYGIDLPELNRILFRTVPLNKGKLIAYTLENVTLAEENSVGIVCLNRDTLARFSAEESDCEGLIDYVRDLAPVEIACTLRESSDGKIRGSLRSKWGADVSEIATQFGGGGHSRAAGFTLCVPMEKAKELVLCKMVEAVRKWKASLQS
jgi:phosphoesterase RecJ-like protein